MLVLDDSEGRETSEWSLHENWFGTSVSKDSIELGL